MLKISITLPNNARINLETADGAVIDKILAVVLRDIDRNLNGTAEPKPLLPAAVAAPAAATPPPSVPPTDPDPPPDPAPAPVQSWETADLEMPERESDPSPWPAAVPAISVTAAVADTPAADLDPEDADWPEFADAEDDDSDNGAADAAGAPPIAAPRLAVNGAAAARPGMFAPSEQAFIDFCREASPLGDMRRVVVAAEAASRYLGMSGVDAQGLGHLFNLAGWPPAHSFTQTLRNAARSKFRWLERVPGRAGYYAVTDLGRKTALGE